QRAEVRVCGRDQVPGRQALSSPAVSPTRRGFIRSALLAVGVAPGGGRWRTRRAAATSTEPALSSEEIDDLVAYAEVLVGGQPLSPTERTDLGLEIDARAGREIEYLTLYRTTARLLQRLSGGRFARLAFAERTALAARHRLSSDVLPDEPLGAFPDEARLVRTRARRDLIADYYGSPAGWRVVGYRAFPGTCGDLFRYTRADP